MQRLPNSSYWQGQLQGWSVEACLCAHVWTSQTRGWSWLDEFLEPVWSHGPILPPSLVDLLDTPEEEQEENEEEAGVYDYEELLDDLDDDD